MTAPPALRSFRRLARAPGRALLRAVTGAGRALGRGMGLEEVHTHTLIPGLLGRDPVVIDLGAHDGAFGRDLLDRPGVHGGRVYAVEASPDLAAGLERRGDPRVSVLHGAVGESDGPVTLHPSSNPQANSLYEPVAAFDRQRVRPPVTVPGYTLESLLKTWSLSQVDVLKVDVEGAEGPLLTVAEDDALRRCRQVTVEFHDFVPALRMGPVVATLRRRFRALGFTEVVASRPRGDHGDVLFVRADLLSVPRRWGLALLGIVLGVEARLRRWAQLPARPETP